jgi:hypothetical protein
MKKKENRSGRREKKRKKNCVFDDDLNTHFRDKKTKKMRSRRREEGCK